MKKENLLLRFLYQTKTGRFILKIAICPWVSWMAGVFLNSRFSGWLANVYIRKYRIDMRAYQKKNYVSFNDFFTRKRSSLPITFCGKYLISPCDAYLTVYPINQNSVYRIKHIQYSLRLLLRDTELAKRYAGGYCFLYRLTPQHYHRYCYVCDGIKEQTRRIRGKLHCVRPIAYTSVPVFAENSREYTIIHSEEFGKVVQMEVGALLVGKIHNHFTENKVTQGAEKGYFEFGGSTIIVLIEKGKVQVEPMMIRQSKAGIETEVHLGMRIGILHER